MVSMLHFSRELAYGMAGVDTMTPETDLVIIFVVITVLYGADWIYLKVYGANGKGK